jgi:hypothetical protein
LLAIEVSQYILNFQSTNDACSGSGSGAGVPDSSSTATGALYSIGEFSAARHNGSVTGVATDGTVTAQQKLQKTDLVHFKTSRPIIYSEF